MKVRVIIGILVAIVGFIILYLVAHNDTWSKVVMYTILPLPWIIIFWHHKSTSLFIGRKADKIAKFLFFSLLPTTIACIIISFINNAKAYTITDIIFPIAFIQIFAFLSRILYLRYKRKEE